MGSKKKTTTSTTPAPAPPQYAVLLAYASRWRKIVVTKAFARAYAGGALAVLLTTTLYWSWLGARIQANNADQLVNPYLFENAQTFQNALLPGQHTFLLKWPLFWLTHVLGASVGAFTFVTIGTVLLTVGALAYLLFRIERRPLLFGTLCLALASVMLLVPTQPYPGALLPVNMAMIATRNLEYIVYLAAVVLCVRCRSVTHWRFWAGVGLLGLLFASDKLFVPLGVGSAVAALIASSIVRRHDLVAVAAKWFCMTAGGVIGASALLAGAGRVTHIAAQNGVGPYSAAHGASQFVLGAVQAVLGIATNLGANPATDTRLLHTLPREAWSALTAPGGLAFLVNVLVLAGGIWMAGYFIASSLQRRPEARPDQITDSGRPALAVLLVWSSVMAALVFVASHHYYPVDARYLAIWFFALFAAAAAYLHGRQWRVRYVVIAGAVLFASSGMGLLVVHRTYTDERRALAGMHDRNELVARTLKYHPVHTLVGDYWRVLPVRAAAGGKLNVTPLASCKQPRDVLSSRRWQPNLSHEKFAYLLTMDASLTDYPSCTLNQIIKDYGRPNSSVVISGKVKQPNEMLLFYDHGLHQRYSSPPAKVPSTAVPATLDQLPTPTCTGRSIMNIVAHEDDDLLFMNPDVMQALRDGDCVRTVYLTAGDAGHDQLYWLGRERGSKAAYATMLGQRQNIWVDRIGRLATGQYVSISAMRNVMQASLIFLRLPDGNLNGNGFGASHFQSLAQLHNNAIVSINTVDAQSSYTSVELTATLTELMDHYQPTEVWTQIPVNMSKQFRDHSDHLTTGAYTREAFAAYKNHDSAQLKYYIGYPVRGFGENVPGPLLEEKRAIFFAYAQFDGATCSSNESCSNSAYSQYLPREYTQELP